MAWTVTKYPTVFGNKRAVGLKLVADAATQTVETGLKTIEWFTLGIASLTTCASLHIKPNLGAEATAIAGSLGCSGFTSGDEIYITVFGQ